MTQGLKACLKRRGSDIQGQKRTRKRTPHVALITLVVFVAFGILVLLFNYFSSEREPRALLKVESSPMGAEVFMNGSFRGRTPLEIELPLNKYEASMRLKDYYEWKGQFTLEEEEESRFVTLIPQDKEEL